MIIRRSRYRTARSHRPYTVLAVLALSVASISIDATDHRLTWSLLSSAGSVVVLKVHARLTQRRYQRPALQVLYGSARTIQSTTEIRTRAAG
jgi:hypothetical protein